MNWEGVVFLGEYPSSESYLIPERVSWPWEGVLAPGGYLIPKKVSWLWKGFKY